MPTVKTLAVKHLPKSCSGPERRKTQGLPEHIMSDVIDVKFKLNSICTFVPERNELKE